MCDFLDYDCLRENVKTEYFVNKDKRTVVCIITTINDFKRRLAKYNLADEDYDDIDEDIRVYKGVAKCSEEDEWNEAYGRRLAEYRATRARQVDINNELRKYVMGINDCLMRLEKYGFIKNPHRPLEKE